MSQTTVTDAVLFIVVSIALYTDLKTGKIYNLLTFPSMLLGIFLASYFNGVDGASDSVCGIFLGIIIGIVPFFLGAWGGGDGKLMMAVGALKGPKFLFYAFLYTGVAAFFVSLLIILLNKSVRKNILPNISLTILGTIVAGPRLTDGTPAGRGFYFSIPIFIGTVISLLQERMYGL